VVRAVLCVFLLSSCSSRNKTQEEAKGRQDSLDALLHLEGQDLDDADSPQGHAARELLEALLPSSKRPPSQERPQSGDPWRVWKWNEGNAPLKVVVFESDRNKFIPGNSQAFVHVFSERGEIISTSTFHTGWRIGLTDARRIESSGIGIPLLEIHSEQLRNGADMARQYYALLSGEVALVRLENSRGEAVRNSYRFGNHLIGPEPPRRSAESWEAIILSREPATALSGLVWLGGNHLDLSWPYMRPESGTAELEDMDQFKMWEEVRKRPAVRRRMDELRQSSIDWIQEEALLVRD